MSAQTDAEPTTDAFEEYDRIQLFPERVRFENVQIADGLTEETVAFNAEIVIDDEQVGSAENSGEGGPDMIRLTGNDEQVFEQQCREYFRRRYGEEVLEKLSSDGYNYPKEKFSSILRIVGDLAQQIDNDESDAYEVIMYDFEAREGVEAGDPLDYDADGSFRQYEARALDGADKAIDPDEIRRYCEDEHDEYYVLIVKR